MVHTFDGNVAPPSIRSLAAQGCGQRVTLSLLAVLVSGFLPVESLKGLLCYFIGLLRGLLLRF
jgi:hypothetical protein